MVVQSSVVRQKFPLETTYSRQVLPHVVGFPHLRVLRLIRHPIAKVFPVRVLYLRSHFLNPETRQCMGLPKFLSASLRPCHSLG
jgi:hypothetical protein